MAASSTTAAPGDLDASFSGDGWDTQNVFAEDCARDVAVQPDGRIVVAGSCDGGVTTGFSVMRYLADGSPDQDFGTDGVVNVPWDPPGANTNDRAHGVALQPDGKIVVAGSSELTLPGTGAGGDNFAVARLLPGGELDPDFNADGPEMNADGRLVINFNDIDLGRDVAIAPDGSIYVGGSADVFADGDDFGVAKVTPQGTLDAGYGSGGKARVHLGAVEALHAIALQPDGKVLATGLSVPAGMVSESARTIGLARLTTGGQPDPSFDDDGRRTLDFGPGGEVANAVTVDAAGRILVAGTANSGTDLAVARLLSGNGATDLGFDGDGRATADTGAADAGSGVAALGDGKLVVTGHTSSGANPYNLLIARFTATGAPDAGFGNVSGSPGLARHDLGANEEIAALALAGGGRLVVAGTSYGATRDFLTARLLGDPSPSGGGPSPGPPPALPGADAVDPAVARLTMTRAFAAARRGGAVATGRRRRPVGATVRYTLSEPSSVRFTVQRRARGRRVGRRCVKQTRRNRSRRRCARYARVRGSFAHAGQSGANALRFTGRLRGRKLRPGRYRLVAVATDGAGNKSQAKRRKFRIVRR